MNGRGDNVKLLARLQAAFGTAEAAAEGAFRDLPFYSYNVVPGEELGTDDAIRGDHYPGDTVDGLQALSGSLVVPMGLASIGWHLMALLGAPTTNEVQLGEYQHSFEPAATPVPVYQTIGRTHADVARYFVQDSIFYNGFSLNAQKNNERARLSFDVIGRQEVREQSALDSTAVRYDPDQVPVGFSGKMKIDGTEAAAITALNAQVSLNGEADQETMNGLATAAGVDAGEWSANGSIDTRFRDETFYDLAAGGTLVDLVLEYTIGEALAIVFTFNKARLERTGVPVNGRGIITSSFNWRVGRPQPGTVPFSILLANAVADYTNPV